MYCFLAVSNYVDSNPTFVILENQGEALIYLRQGTWMVYEVNGDEIRSLSFQGGEVFLSNPPFKFGDEIVVY